MKKTIFASIILACVLGLSLSGCSLGATGGEPPVPDYNEDVQVVAPEDVTLEHFDPQEGTTYYTSNGLSLWMEVRGEYLEIDYFSLEDNKRVYDNLYLYEDDYFVMVADDMVGWYASLSDPSDLEFAEEEKQAGEDVQINVKKSGVYKLIFDTDTLKFDMEYKAEIETPLYYTIKNCSIYSVKTDWVAMSVNPENADEFMISNFSVEANKLISFFNNVHTSNYKVTLKDDLDFKLAEVESDSNVIVNVGGNYDIYINRKTYEVNLRLLNPDTATYSCVYYDGNNFNVLSPYDASVPYVFRQRVEVTTKYTTSLPKFHTEKYRTYDLSAVASDLITAGGNFKNPGTYDVIVNLKTFEISVELLPE